MRRKGRRLVCRDARPVNPWFCWLLLPWPTRSRVIICTLYHHCQCMHIKKVKDPATCCSAIPSSIWIHAWSELADCYRLSVCSAPHPGSIDGSLSSVHSYITSLFRRRLSFNRLTLNSTLTINMTISSELRIHSGGSIRTCTLKNVHYCIATYKFVHVLYIWSLYYNNGFCLMQF